MLRFVTGSNVVVMIVDPFSDADDKLSGTQSEIKIKGVTVVFAFVFMFSNVEVIFDVPFSNADDESSKIQSEIKIKDVSDDNC